MHALVTGAGGFIGFHVTNVLIRNGLRVRALVRSKDAAANLKRIGAEPVEGDITDPPSLERAVAGCSEVYHLAADYRLWVPNPETMYAVNVQGTKNVMEAAVKGGVGKIVYTSSVGVLATSPDGTPANEKTPSSQSAMIGHYKRSKYLAEEEVRRYAAQGVPVVIVNPSTPVGPVDRKPTPTGKTIVDFLNGKIPAYVNTGLNFVDVEDVAEGHWLASKYGKAGERYILGNRNLTLREFFSILADISQRKPPKYRIPLGPVLIIAYLNEAVSRITRKPPAVPVTGVKMARSFMFFDCSKAVAELKMPQNPVGEALRKAVFWFTENGYVKA